MNLVQESVLELPDIFHEQINLRNEGAKWFDAGIRFDPASLTVCCRSHSRLPDARAAGALRCDNGPAARELQVLEMLPDCAAQQSGAIAKGDVLVAIEGEPCSSLGYSRVCERMLGRCVRVFASIPLHAGGAGGAWVAGPHPGVKLPSPPGRAPCSS